MRIPASELSWVLEWEAIKGEKGRKEIGKRSGWAAGKVYCGRTEKLLASEGSRGKLKEVTAVEMKRTVAVKEGSKGTFGTT